MQLPLLSPTRFLFSSTSPCPKQLRHVSINFNMFRVSLRRSQPCSLCKLQWHRPSHIPRCRRTRPHTCPWPRFPHTHWPPQPAQLFAFLHTLTSSRPHSGTFSRRALVCPQPTQTYLAPIGGTDNSDFADSFSITLPFHSMPLTTM